MTPRARWSACGGGEEGSGHLRFMTASVAARPLPTRSVRVNGLFGRALRLHPGGMWILLILLLVVWAALSVFGFLVEGLLWLAVLGIVLFLATALIGLLRGRAATKE